MNGEDRITPQWGIFNSRGGSASWRTAWLQGTLSFQMAKGRNDNIQLWFGFLLLLYSHRQAIYSSQSPSAGVQNALYCWSTRLDNKPTYSTDKTRHPRPERVIKCYLTLHLGSFLLKSVSTLIFLFSKFPSYLPVLFQRFQSRSPCLQFQPPTQRLKVRFKFL